MVLQGGAGGYCFFPKVLPYGAGIVDMYVLRRSHLNSGTRCLANNILADNHTALQT